MLLLGMWTILGEEGGKVVGETVFKVSAEVWVMERIVVHEERQNG